METILLPPVGQCLHSVSGPQNPYQVSLSLIARTLSSFDDDNLIPCYGFGDVNTREHSVFSFFPNDDAPRGLDVLLAKYRQIAPLVDLSGPTSFEPLIRQAMRRVYYTGMRFHLLLILADGQISSAWKAATMQAIYDASFFPLSIVMVGVGDGPWDEMRTFDDAIPQRRFDNFQFVEYNRIMSNPSLVTEERREASFALQVLMELPDQYRIAEEMMGPNAQNRVRPIIAEIPPSILIDPPVHFNMPLP